MLSALGPVNNIRVTGILFNNQSSGEGQGMIFSNEQAPLDTYEIDHCAFTGPNVNCNAIKFNAQSYGTGSNVSVPVKNVYIHHNTFFSLGRMGIEMQNHGWERGETIAWQLDNYRIEDNEFSDLGRVDGSNGMAISFTGPNQNIYIRRNKVVDAKYAAYEFVGSRYVEMTNNTATAVNNTYTGISISDNSHHVTTQLKFTNNNIVVKGNAFQSYGGDGGSVTNWEATNNTFISTTPSSGDMGSIKLQRTSGGRFINNTVRTGGTNAIFFDNAPQNFFASNSFSNEDSPSNDILIRFYNSGTYNNELANSNTYKKQQGFVTSNYAREESGAYNNIFGGTTPPPNPPPTSNVTGTILLLNGNGSDGSQNIVDASPMARPVSQQGSVRISTAQKKYGPSSLYFDGNSYLTIPSSSDFDFGTGDYTIECFMYPTATSDYPTIVSRRTNSGGVVWNTNISPNNAGFGLNVTNSNNSFLNPGPLSNNQFSLNTWYHVAVVASGGQRKLYVNGSLVATASSVPSMELNPDKGLLLVGAQGSGSNRFQGYMHLRLTQGKALYTNNFTPPETFDASLPPVTTPTPTPTPTPSTGTVLLLNGNGSDGSQNIVDASPMARPVSQQGSVRISTAQKKYGPSSLYFDGNSYLTIPSSSDFDFGTGDYTIECFMYPTATSDYPTIVSRRTNSGGVVWNTNISPNNAGFGLNVTNSNNSFLNPGPLSNNQFSLNTWYHVAVVASGGQRKLYVNGSLVATASSVPSMELNPDKGLLLVGAQGSGSNRFQGYMHLRLTKGQALYTDNFTPPETFDASLPPVTTPTPTPTPTPSTGTVLLLNGNGSDGSQNIVDASPMARPVSQQGSVRISTAQKKYGPSSLYFDGNSYLTIPSSSDFDFGTGDYTIECFMYPTATGDYPTIVSRRTNSGGVVWNTNISPNNAGFGLNVTNSNNSFLNPGPLSNNQFSLNTWYHVAVVASGGQRKLYVNGSLVATASSVPSMELNPDKGVLMVGAQGAGSCRFQGYMHLRLTKGQALYTNNFNPPTSF
ncbi:LamG-like jellyroll fold domain-containing protein [Spirosoma sp. KUDC1026]|uniref:LamG-like jellyroll fold domain-containing protein n=1 Tax=Spirosoma sp. KUDC1026 TaxID=2745947 RepID=UPI00159BBD4C|nr:LamG-like jellyroll fold domain-containing protein [Spirosoma sp. KUDC1026]QKZ11376.1 hypothetical protein HU175_01470 [Spirosoma sp. KUDC1026]